MPERRFNLKLLTGIDIPACLFKAGDTIFREGEEGNEPFIIRSGGVRIRSPIAPSMNFVKTMQSTFCGADCTIDTLESEFSEAITLISPVTLRLLPSKLKTESEFSTMLCTSKVFETRTHLCLDKDAPVSRAIQTVGRIFARPVLGGLHHQYVRI